MDILLFFIAIYYVLHRNWNIPIIILLTLSTDYWGVFEEQSEFIFAHSASDIGLALLCVMIFIVHKRKQYVIPSQIGALKKILIVFYLFIGLSIVADIILHGTPLTDVIKTTRQLLFIPGGFILFRYIPSNCYNKIFKDILTINTIVCVLCLLQYLHVISFLKFMPNESSWVQIYIPSGLFVSAILLASDFGKQYRSILRYTMLGLCFSVSVITTIRSFNFAVLLCVMFIYVFSSGKFRLSRVFIGLALCATVLTAIFTNDAFESKLDNTSRDIEVGSFATRRTVYSTAVDIATSSVGSIILGSGWHSMAKIEEGESMDVESTQAAYLTSDIAWSLLFLRFGILGTIIYTLIWLFFIRYGWIYRRASKYALILCVLSVGYLIISIAGIQIYLMRNLLIPILLLYITVAQLNYSLNKH